MQPKCVDFKACWIIIENQYGTVGTRVDLKRGQSKSLELDDRILLQKKLSRGIVKSQRPRSKLVCGIVTDYLIATIGTVVSKS